MKDRVRNFFDYFFLGILSILPILLVVKIVAIIEGWLRNAFLSIHGYYENYWVTIVLFAVTIAFLGYFGYSIRHGKAYLYAVLEGYVSKLPVISTVYRVSKKLIGIFTGRDSRPEHDVVYVEYPKDDVWVPAYVTNHLGELLVLYVPTSPNPTSGFTVIVHESKVIRSAMSLEETSSFVISVGVDFPHIDDAIGKLMPKPKRTTRKASSADGGK